MSGLILNLDLSCSDQPSSENIRAKPAGNFKHQRFIKRRKFLECKGLLRDKQNGCRKIQGPKKLNEGLQPMQNEKKHTSTSTLTHPETPVLKPTSWQSTAPKSTYKSLAPKPTHSITESNPSSFNGAPVASDFLKTSTQSKKYEDSAATSSQNLTTFSSTMSSVIPASLCPPVFLKAPPFGNPIKYLALDCEMVGTGPKGCLSELARCSIVSYDGDVVYDKYIMPTRPVTDFRTKWSGIRKHHLRNATPFPQARKEIVKILAGKVVVGHAIYNDFKSLRYSHPASLTRDTSRIPLLNKMAGFPERQAVSLKRLAKSLLNQDIQVGNKGHSSVEDARTTMQLYKAVEEEWERTSSFISEAR